jgi:VCBS repeat-containing protein
MAESQQNNIDSTIPSEKASDWSAEVRAVKGDVIIVADNDQQPLLGVGDQISLGQTILSVADSALVLVTSDGQVISIGYDQQVTFSPEWLDELVNDQDALPIQDIETLEQRLAQGQALDEILPAPAAGGPTTTVTSAGDNPARVDRVQQATTGIRGDEFGTQSLSVSVDADTDTDDSLSNDSQSDGAGPIAVSDVVVAQEDQTLVTANLLLNDSLPDLSSVTDFDAVSVQGAAITYNGNGSFTYQSAANFFGSDSFTYTLIDFNGQTSTGVVTVNVAAVNDIPTVSAAVGLVISEDTFAASVDLLANASDVDAVDALSVTNLIETSGGDVGGVSLVNNALVITDGYYDYLAQGQTLTLNYTYDVSDGNGGVAATSASITINGTNDAPEVKADIDGLLLSVGSASGNVVFNDSDVDNPAGDLSVVTPAYIVGKYGNLLLNEDGSFDYQLANSGGSIITGPTNNLVTYWNVDNNGQDLAPGGSVSDTLTLRNGASYSANGRVGQALAFDGVNDYVSVANSADINSAPSDFVQRSISLWFKADDTSGRQVIFEEGGSINGLNIYVENGEVFVGGWSTSEGHGWNGTWHSEAVTDGQWHHVSLVLDASANGANTTAPNSFFAYLDGQDISGVDTSASELYRGHTGDINVGRSGGSIRYDDGSGGYESDGSANYFAGEVDDVRIYDGALSAAEVDELANPPIVIDNSGGTQVDPSDVLQGDGPTDGLVTRWQMDDATDSAIAGAKADTLNLNGAQITVDASRGNVLEFSGAQIAEPGDSADINIGTFDERTVSFWFNADDTSGRQVIYKEGGSVRGLTIYIDNGELYVSGWNTPGGESGWSGSFVSSTGIAAGQWHQVSLVLDGGTSVSADALSMYLDGLLVGQTSGSQLWSHSGDINLGGSDTTVYYHDGFSNAKNYFDGKLDDGRIYNKALDANEAAELHNPSSDAVVIDTFEYQISDGQDNSDTADIKFVVTDRNLIEGDNADNNLLGGAGDDVIFGRQGSDTATGGAGSDTYVWVDGDQSSAVVPVDVISDFQRGTDGDLLDLRDLLQGENVANVTDYLQFESDGTDTVVSIDSQGNAGASVDQQIVLEGIDLTLLGNNQAIANQLLGDGNLHIDT